MSYGDKTKAASLAGSTVEESTISDEMLESVDEFINVNVREEGFGKYEDQEEYYDIKRSDQSELLLKNHPVLSVSSLKDDMRSNSPVTVSSDAYVVDLETGIIQLSPMANVNSENEIAYFTKGFNSVYVKYTYGFETTPETIVQLANLMLAKWAKVLTQQADADGLKSVSIGDYKETYDTGFMSVKSEFDDQISIFLKRAKIKYGRGY